MAWCSCNIAAEFKQMAGLGIISANFKASTNFTLTEDGMAMHGPATGDLSITAYAPSTDSFVCPGRASASFGWIQKVDCDSSFGTLIVYFIPNGISRSYMEGDVSNQIQMETMTSSRDYQTFEANASSGPTTPSLILTHRDGYNLTYNGNPIRVTTDSGKTDTAISFMNGILPPGSKLYMNSFNWTHDPPDIPRVSYSFLFKYDG